MNRPYKIPGGLVMGFWAAVSSSFVFLFMLFPNSPFYVSSLTIKAFFICMGLGIIVFFACRDQRKRISAAEMEHEIFHTYIGAK